MAKPTETQFPPLEAVTLSAVSTRQAAYYLDRAPQTMRVWAQNGYPLNPVRIGKRLAWKVEDLRRVLGVAA